MSILENPHVEEILQKDELERLIKSGTKLKHYIGFEISGKLHVGQAILTMSIIKDLLDLDAEVIIFLADWHSWINHKLGGDRDFIKKAARQMLQGLFIASAKILNIDECKINFVLGSELYEKNPVQWANFMEINQHVSLARIKRSINIMGRKRGDVVDFAQLTYPTLQVADIFTMQRNIIHAGMDQRKAHVIARQVAKKLKIMPLRDKQGNIIKPIAIHHKLVPSLLKPPKWPITQEEIKDLIADLKMSKSKPNGAIFLNDTPEEIRDKINQAFCPTADLSYNPVAIWTKMFIFDLGFKLDIKRPAKWGGNLHIETWEEFKEIFENNKLHPQDLKTAFAEHLINLLVPARNYIKEHKEIEEITDIIKNKITR